MIKVLIGIKKEDYNHYKKYHLQLEPLEVEESEMIGFLGRFISYYNE